MILLSSDNSRLLLLSSNRVLLLRSGTIKLQTPKSQSSDWFLDLGVSNFIYSRLNERDVSV